MTTRRILARVGNPDDAFPELEWVEQRSEPFDVAVRRIQALVDDGSLIVVREEQVP